jgi:hypothetical protein
MKRLLGCLLLLSAVLAAQTPVPTSMESTLLALKDPQANRGARSMELALEMALLANRDQSPAQTTVQRFSEDLTTALLGKDITTIRAAALQKSIRDVLSGKGSTFLPASRFRQALASCGVEDRTVQAIVDQFTHMGQEVRGPDDIPVHRITRK